jgi:hypothetical protein
VATVTPTLREIRESTCDVRSMNSCTSVMPASESEIIVSSCGARRALPGDLLDVIAIRLGGRNPPGRSMRSAPENPHRRGRPSRCEWRQGSSPSRLERASVRDPTGSPVEMNVSTMAVRISRSRFPILGSAGIVHSVSCLEPSGYGRGENLLHSILPNYFRCRSLGFGPKVRSYWDSRNG